MEARGGGIEDRVGATPVALEETRSMGFLLQTWHTKKKLQGTFDWVCSASGDLGVKEAWQTMTTRW
jgi:hypothetical protein